MTRTIKNILSLLLLLCTLSLQAQPEVISSAALQSSRFSKSSKSYIGAPVGVSSVTGAALSDPALSLPSVAGAGVKQHAGRNSSYIYTPFATDMPVAVSGGNRPRRLSENDFYEDDDNPGEMGEKSDNYPLGDGWVLLLFAAGWLAVRRRS